MEIKLEHFLALPFIAPASILNGPTTGHKTVRGFCLPDSLSALPPCRGQLIQMPALPTGKPVDWDALTKQLQLAGALGLTFKKGQLTEMDKLQLGTAADNSLCLIELAADADIGNIVALLQYAFTTDEAGQIVQFAQVVADLRQAVEENEVKGLLKTLHRWCRCQSLAVIREDVYAYPPIAVFSEELTNPSLWKKLPPYEHMPWLEHRYLPERQEYILRYTIVKEGCPTGSIALFRKDEDFDEMICLLLDYCGVYSTGLSYNYLHSQRIHNALQLAYENQPLPTEELSILPAEGYALVLREDSSSRQKELSKPELNNSFMGYLIHNTMTEESVYTFIEDQSCLLFVSTVNVRDYMARLERLLREYGRYYLFGVSRLYASEQIGTAFAEARHATDIGLLLENGNSIIYFEELGVYRLVNYPNNSWPINQMLSEMTAQLNTMERDKMLVLTETLTSLVNNNFNYTKTSAELYAHPNTIRYRISLLEELWHCDLTNDEDRLLFRLICKLLPLWQKHTGYEP